MTICGRVEGCRGLRSEKVRVDPEMSTKNVDNLAIEVLHQVKVMTTEPPCLVFLACSIVSQVTAKLIKAVEALGVNVVRPELQDRDTWRFRPPVVNVDQMADVRIAEFILLDGLPVLHCVHGLMKGSKYCRDPVEERLQTLRSELWAVQDGIDVVYMLTTDATPRKSHIGSTEASNFW